MRSHAAELGEMAKAMRAASAHTGKDLPFVRHHCSSFSVKSSTLVVSKTSARLKMNWKYHAETVPTLQQASRGTLFPWKFPETKKSWEHQITSRFSRITDQGQLSPPPEQTQS